MRPEEAATTRERIVEILRRSSRPLTVDEIAGELGTDIAAEDVYEHLVHAARSLRARSGGREILVMEPPYCKKCGYVFKNLNRPRKPSRCPRCKGEWVAAPRFTIARRG
ncbi:MAG: transcriptional regulator [Desulfurococcaceae archaeon]